MQLLKSVTKNYKGLNEEDVQKSRIKYGINQIVISKRKTFIKKYLESFGEPTIKILLIALVLNLIFLIRNFNWFNSIGIAVSIILATFASTVSEFGSKLAFEGMLEDTKKIKCKIWRSGDLVELPTTDIVTGDYIQLEPGDKIPADGILIEGRVKVDQSFANGGIKEVFKSSDIKIDLNVSPINIHNPNRLFCGSIVNEGGGTMLVQAVGQKTLYGNLSREIRENNGESPLKKKLKQLTGSISKLGYMISLLILILSLFKSIVINNGFNTVKIMAYASQPYVLTGDIIKSLTFAIAIIVVTVPEGLPVLINIILSSNMKRMIQDNVLVRNIAGIETAAGLNILFTDKTETLTKGNLKVTTFISGENIVYENMYKLKENKKLWKIIYISCVFNNCSKLGYDGRKRMAVGGNLTDRAILNFAATYPLVEVYRNIVASMPFSSLNKFSLTEIDGEKNITLIKGAPENIIPFCTNCYDIGGNKIKLSNMLYLSEQIKEMASKGLRVLALATAENNLNNVYKEFSDLTLVGIVGLKDELRPNIKNSVEKVRNAGVQVVMITGDDINTARATALETGIINKSDYNGIIASEELGKLSDEQVKKLLPSLRVVTRAVPDDKIRLIKLSQTLGLVTGMTGDAIHDAPALQKADVGFSMGSGTEAAKESSDIVILDNNFISIGKAILYGRTIFINIRKFLIFQLTVNVCVVGISLFGQFLGNIPITIIQMLWLNMVMDTLAGIAFACEPPLPEYMNEKPKKFNEKIININMVYEIFISCAFIIILCLLFLTQPNFHNLFRFSPHNNYLLTGFFGFFMFLTLFNSLNIRTENLNLLSDILKSKTFVTIMGAVAITQILLLYIGGNLFRTFGLTLNEFIVILSLSFMIIPFDLIRKSLKRIKNNGLNDYL